MHRLPHKAPVKFVAAIDESHEFDATTQLAFPCIPTLPMIAEAAAQSTVFVKVTEIKKTLGIPEDDTVEGMLLKIKAQLHRDTPPQEARMRVDYVSNLDNFFIMKFVMSDASGAVAEGELHTILTGGKA